MAVSKKAAKKAVAKKKTAKKSAAKKTIKRAASKKVDLEKSALSEAIEAPSKTDCMCKQKKPGGNFFCFRLVQGKWIQASAIGFPSKEVCEAASSENREYRITYFVLKVC